MSFDLASLPPLVGEGQVSELHVTMSNPSLVRVLLKKLSIDTCGKLKWVSNGRMVEFLIRRTKPKVFSLDLGVC